MKITVEQPSARELVDRSRVLVHVMLEHPDDIGPNYALLLILADQLQLLRDALKRMRSDGLGMRNYLNNFTATTASGTDVVVCFGTIRNPAIHSLSESFKFPHLLSTK